MSILEGLTRICSDNTLASPGAVMVLFVEGEKQSEEFNRYVSNGQFFFFYKRTQIATLQASYA